MSDITIPVYYMKGNHDINTKCMMKANTITKTGWAPDWANKVYYKFGVNPNNGSVLYSAVNESTWNGTDLLYVRDESQLIPNHLWAMHCQRDIDAVFDSNNPLGGYFYKDFENEKVRVIVTNCYDVASQLEGINWGVQQTKFIAEQALNFSNKEDASAWSVIVFAHDMPADLPVDDTSVAATERCKYSIIKVLQAFQNGTSCTCTLMDNRSYTFDFSNQGAMTIIATIHGHAHEDMHDTVYGWNNIGTIASHNSWGADYIGTIKEFGVSVFTVDTENKVLYETRIGRGNSRAFSFGDTIGLV
jgi:hypothetical protein